MTKGRTCLILKDESNHLPSIDVEAVNQNY